jgi:hypothetical protein
MRLFSDATSKRKFQAEVLEAGRELLAKYQFNRQNNGAIREDYDLGTVVSASLNGEEGKSIARRLCRELLTAAARYEANAHEYNDLMKGLFKVHPADVLDEIVAAKNGVRMMEDLLHFGENPINGVADEVILGWCDRDPQVRYPFAAAVVPLFKQGGVNEEPREWETLTRGLLIRGPDKEAILRAIVKRLRPTTWSGSLATRLEAGLRLFDRLDPSGMPGLAGPLDEAKVVLKNQVDWERRRETEEDRGYSERFE